MMAMALTGHCEIQVEGEAKKTSSFSSRKDPLTLMEMSVPIPAAGEILVRVSVCGICHTELDVIEGRLKPPGFPIVPGHEVVGRVEALGPGVEKFREGDRVGIAWIHSTCGTCRFCRKGSENLCDRFRATGLHAQGGYAQYTKVSEDFAYPIPEIFSDSEAAPLLCAGVIGLRLEVREFDMCDVNEALVLLKQGKMQGAGVLRIPR